MDIAFNNTGSINVNSGTLRLTRGGTNTNGSYAMQGNSMIEFDCSTGAVIGSLFTQDVAEEVYAFAR